MTCCAAAICAVVRHSVSSPLPVLGCSALPRHCHACLGAQSCDRARVASACAGTYPQGCSSPRPLCSGVTNQVYASRRATPRCSGNPNPSPTPSPSPSPNPNQARLHYFWRTTPDPTMLCLLAALGVAASRLADRGDLRADLNVSFLTRCGRSCGT